MFYRDQALATENSLLILGVLLCHNKRQPIRFSLTEHETPPQPSTR
jgi:hypothetical protein